jgi:hypothetical protein
MARFARLGMAFLLAASGTAASGQTIYKLQQADGSTVYSDKVLPRTKVQKEITDKEGALSIVAPPGPVASRDAQPQADARVSPQIARRDELWRERNLALTDLDKARRAKVDGEEPLPGERTANATGGSRLNEAYWSRQDLLQRTVDSAQRRLERAEQNLRAAGS